MHEVDRNGLRDPMNVEDISRFFIRRPQYSISMNIRESRLVRGDHRITFRETLELMAGTCSSFPAKSSTATCPAGPLVS